MKRVAEDEKDIQEDKKKRVKHLKSADELKPLPKPRNLAVYIYSFYLSRFIYWLMCAF
jgi:hypothetical protein